MRTAETVLNINQNRGQRGLPIEDVYRQLFNPELYLRAYGRIYRNQGAMTPGSTEETVDGMSRDKIERLIEQLRYERFRWTPVRRTQIPKKNGKLRPLGIPTWSDKLVQEVMRSLLDAYYEPQFSDHAHGFRPNRGCHTALRAIQRWGGVNWFIEGDIKGCFDNIDHQVVLSILGEKIHDNRFLRLLGNLLKVGYLEEWKYRPTLSGTPQGGIISPILSNIYLDRLDQFVERELIPRFTKGQKRRINPTYVSLREASSRWKNRGDFRQAKELLKAMKQTPSIDTKDPDYRRLYYVRYADDFLLGFAGPKAEAEEIKGLLREFLHRELRLILSEDKTLVTHAQTEAARFLGYEIKRFVDNTKRDRHGRRCINHRINFRIPREVVAKRCALYQQHGSACTRVELIDDHEYTIVSNYQSQYRGFVQYYSLAHNQGNLTQLHWVMETSLLKTLAAKQKIRVSEVVRRYKRTVPTPEGPRRCLEVRVEREGKAPLIARFGGIPFKRQKWAVIKDQSETIHFQATTTEVVQRLLADTCEMCGATAQCQVHHIRRLADLKVPGRRDKPAWVKLMAARRRKTLVVCRDCHTAIHAGKINLSKATDG